MISNKQLDRWLKEQKLSLVLYTAEDFDDLRSVHPEVRRLNRRHMLECVAEENLFWEERVVFFNVWERPSFYISDFLRLSLPKGDWVGPDCWTFEADRLIHAEWGREQEWWDSWRRIVTFDSDHLQEPPVGGEEYHGAFWSDLSEQEQEQHKASWAHMLQEAQVLQGSRLLLPVHLKQLPDEQAPIPRGLHWALHPVHQPERGWIGYHRDEMVKTDSLKEFLKLSEPKPKRGVRG